MRPAARQTRAVTGRSAVARAAGRPSLRPVPRRSTQTKRPWAQWALLLLLLLLAGLGLRGLWAPEPEPTPEEPMAIQVPAAGPLAGLVKKPTVTAKAPISPSQRALLMKAIEARAADLRVCGRPPGAPARLLTRIKVAHAGTVQGVNFVSSESLPKGLADCVKQKVSAWSFVNVGITSDVDVLVSFGLL